MNKTITRIIAIVLALLLALSAITMVFFTTLAEAEATTPTTLTQYEFQIQVVETLDAVRVTQATTYTNQTGQPLSQILFQLYPNAYRRQMTTPFELEAMQDAYPDGYLPGGVDFFLVEADGKAVDWGVQGNAEAYLRVNAELSPGESCTFKFGYEVILPRCTGQLGVSTLGWKLNGFYPMLCHWDESLKEFSTPTVQPVGNSLFSDVANYRATVDAPAGWMLASVGEVSNVTANGRTEWTIVADNTRQLSIELGQKLGMYERKSENGVNLRAYATDGGSANRALDTAEKAMKFFSDKLGAYSLAALSLVQCNYLHTSHAMSGMILLDDELMGWNQRDGLEYEVVLNVAKQWFSEVTTGNPSREPWLIEATSSYMALMYYKEMYGQDRFLQELNKRVLPALQMTIPGSVMVDSDVELFASGEEYRIVTRDRGTAALYEVSLSTGEAEFIEGLKKYIEANRGTVASLPDFVAAMNFVSGRELDHLVMEMLQNIGEYANQEMEWYE